MSGIRVENLTFSYPQIPVLRDLSFSVNSGSLLAILGPNGSGKSTLLRLVAGFLSPQLGSIVVGDRSVGSLSSEQRAGLLTLVRQEYLPAFDFSVYETVLMGRTRRLGWFGFESAEDRAAIERALRDTDAIDLADRRLDELSSGQRQRVFIARALVQDTPVLLLDEPTAFLDLKHQLSIFDLLADLKKQSSKTILVVTHDLNLAARYADSMLFLAPDKPCFIGPPEMALDPRRIESFFGVGGFFGRFGDKSCFVPASRRDLSLND
jgi:iron complex transport system ATP-binding protein